MTATVEHIRKQIDRLAPHETRELLLDLQRSFPSLLDPSDSADDEDDAAVESEWDAEIDSRIKDIEEGSIKLISGGEFERNTDALLAKLGIPRPSQ